MLRLRPHQLKRLGWKVGDQLMLARTATEKEFSLRRLPTEQEWRIERLRARCLGERSVPWPDCFLRRRTKPNNWHFIR